MKTAANNEYERKRAEWSPPQLISLDFKETKGGTFADEQEEYYGEIYEISP